MTDAVDWSNPCAKAAALRTAYFNMLSGQQEVEIRTRTLDSEEMVRFAPSNIAMLRSALSDAEAECLAFQAGKPVSGKRFAITARFKPHFQRYPYDRGYPWR